MNNDGVIKAVTNDEFSDEWGPVEWEWLVWEGVKLFELVFSHTILLLSKMTTHLCFHFHCAARPTKDCV